MTKFLLVFPMLALISACDTLEQQQLSGTAGGAALGALVTPDDPLQGALIGGVVGLAAGTLLGRTASGECVYQRQDGSRFVGPC
jgi:hypothetical protein